MAEEVEDVRAALRKRFGGNEKEVALMLSRYVGQDLSAGASRRHGARRCIRPAAVTVLVHRSDQHQGCL